MFEAKNLGRDSIFDNCIETRNRCASGSVAPWIPFEVFRDKRAVQQKRTSIKEVDQATKGGWWMPWRQKAMKDVVSCDKLR